MLVFEKIRQRIRCISVMIYEHLKKAVQNEDNLVTALMEIEEGFEIVPEKIYSAYSSIKPIEKVELIHFFTKYIMRKND